MPVSAGQHQPGEVAGCAPCGAAIFWRLCAGSQASTPDRPSSRPSNDQVGRSPKRLAHRARKSGRPGRIMLRHTTIRASRHSAPVSACRAAWLYALGLTRPSQRLSGSAFAIESGLKSTIGPTPSIIPSRRLATLAQSLQVAFGRTAIQLNP
jgi:hypothetical protein